MIGGTVVLLEHPIGVMFRTGRFKSKVFQMCRFKGTTSGRGLLPTPALQMDQQDRSSQTEGDIYSSPNPTTVSKTASIGRVSRQGRDAWRIDVDSVAVLDSSVTCISEAVGDSDSNRRRRNYHVDEGGRLILDHTPPLSLQIHVLVQYPRNVVVLVESDGRTKHRGKVSMRSAGVFTRRLLESYTYNKARAVIGFSEATLAGKAEALLGMVLPRGYPESVRNQYGTYASWQFSAMVASSAAGVMSTQALLYAMGLGAGAIPLAATLNWVIKDGLGQVGGVAFSSLVNTRFDANPKLWRMVAAVSLDASMLLELTAPLAPPYFLLIASVANVGKNVSFLAASASRAAIHNVLSAKGNLADVTAKAGAQTILACMVGTGTGVALSALFGSEWHAMWPFCLGFSTVHLVANYLSVRRLAIPTIDSQRLRLMVDSYQAGRGVPSPEDLAARESIVMDSLRGQLGGRSYPRIIVGSRLEEAVRDREELDELCRIFQGRPFLISVRGCSDSAVADVHVLLLEGCGTRQVLAATYTAHLAKKLLLDQGLGRSRQRRRSEAKGLAGRPELRGEVLYGVITKALSMADGLSPFSASQYPSLREGAGDRRQKRGGGIGSDFVARADYAGWDMSVLFLEGPKSSRLRLVYANSALLGLQKH